MKYAVVILSDPKAGTEVALARAYNGCALAYDCKQHSDEVVIIFLGAELDGQQNLKKKIILHTRCMQKLKIKY